jgi:hypothetical protein
VHNCTQAQLREFSAKTMFPAARALYDIGNSFPVSDDQQIGVFRGCLRP